MVYSSELNHSLHRFDFLQVFVSNIINEFLFGFQYPYDNCEKLMNFVLGLNDAIAGISR